MAVDGYKYKLKYFQPRPPELTGARERFVAFGYICAKTSNQWP